MLPLAGTEAVGGRPAVLQYCIAFTGSITASAICGHSVRRQRLRILLPFVATVYVPHHKTFLNANIYYISVVYRINL